ncbi:hypothetical protein IF2G_08283 [Cordyceps javanica]|nr:hypothetical protein IF2G_08283 [Cordyceps javanica]
MNGLLAYPVAGQDGPCVQRLRPKGPTGKPCRMVIPPSRALVLRTWAATTFLYRYARKLGR